MSSKITAMDAKAQRVFIGNVVAHLQKTLRAYDGKDPEGLLKSMDESARMIKFVSGGKKKPQLKRGKKKKAAPVVEAPAAEST